MHSASSGAHSAYYTPSQKCLENNQAIKRHLLLASPSKTDYLCSQVRDRTIGKHTLHALDYASSLCSTDPSHCAPPGPSTMKQGRPASRPTEIRWPWLVAAAAAAPTRRAGARSPSASRTRRSPSRTSHPLSLQFAARTSRASSPGRPTPQ